jgi:hypothetical protein
MNSSVYATTMEGGCADFNAFADLDDACVPQADLMAVFAFVAIGLSLTAAFFTLGFGTDIVQLLAASG